VSSIHINAARPIDARAASGPLVNRSQSEAPKFSRQAPVEKSGVPAQDAKGRYNADPFPDHPKLIGATLSNGRILNPSYAEEAGKYDLLRIMNDVSHGKVREASERLNQMSKVDMSDHFENLNVDPKLFQKLGAVINNPRLAPAEKHLALVDVMVNSGAVDFVRNSAE
jgi:hypothetical protein